MSNKGEKIRVQIQQRDIRLMNLCFEHNFLTLDHFEFEYGLTGAREARRRAHKLVEAGYLRRESSPIPERRWYFRLTGKGQQWGASWGQTELPPNRHINLNQFRHDALVSLARQRLDQLWDASFEPERVLKATATESIWSRRKPIVPDGIYTFAYPTGKIAIEVEASDKGKRRFTELIDRWTSDDGFYLVLYIASTRELAEILKRYIRSFKNLEQKIGVVTWDDLRRFAPMAWGPPDQVLSIFQTKNPIPCTRGRS
jgi:DNA-binding PadR family transcriptional regulator